MYEPNYILTKNKKCNASIDLPIEGHCRPTRICMHDCYARFGHQAMDNCVRKQQWLSKYLANPDRFGGLSRLAEECRPLRAVRLNGSGDLLPAHVPTLVRLAEICPETQFWGMTRKPGIARRINSRLPNLRILVSVDASSPASAWKYNGALCFGPRQPEDEVPEDPRIVTVFPRHHGGKVIKGMPHHPKDCQGVWHTISGCMACGRCWNWDIEHLGPGKGVRIKKRRNR